MVRRILEEELPAAIADTIRKAVGSERKLTLKISTDRFNLGRQPNFGRGF
jgi:hypothetical protein